jgi:predicted ATPase
VTRCGCTLGEHQTRLVVVTGGPGAGKTAVLEVARTAFCPHVVVLPEAAGIVWGGGFPRKPDGAARMAAQRAIFRVQRELERMVTDEGHAAVALCDRGTLDGLAYWRGSPAAYWSDVGSSREAELARYHAVIHLRTPNEGYNRNNPLRTETVEEALAIDARIAEVWHGHPRRFVVEASPDYLAKAAQAIALIAAQVPPCCAPR